MGTAGASVASSSGGAEILAETDWRERQARHEAEMRPWIEAFRERRSRRQTHPVHDFLFTYYSARGKILQLWRPAVGMILCGASADAFLADERYVREARGVRLNPAALDAGSRERLRWTASVLAAAQARPPRFNCFGLHEWAMVYRTEAVRHETTPLRLEPAAIADVVESNAVRCSHFDAFRFFTPAAAPRNELQPGRDDRERFEQFGCLHFNMDLYRWSYKLTPWIGADLMRDCFLLALQARELDMRASPYDLSEYGYEPIRIETAAGREQYRLEQERIHLAGKPLAARLQAEIAAVLGAASV